MKQFIGQGYTVAVDVDLSKFFDKVHHDVLVARVSRYIKDKRVLKLIAEGGRHLSRTMATQSGMTNKWLMEQGLISVKDQWVKIHYLDTAR